MKFYKYYKFIEINKWIIILSLILFPFIINSFFNLPIGDDFAFGDIGRNNSIVESVLFWYNSWGGRYTQEFFLTAFNPLTYGYQDFFWIPSLFLILSISISILYLINTVGEKKITSHDTIVLLSVLIFLIFNLMPEIGEVLYWISGAYTFQIGNIFFILLVAIGYKLYFEKKIVLSAMLTIIASILILLISGTNEVSMAYTFGFSVLFLVFNFYNNKNKIVFAIILIITSSIASYYSIFAPGNFIRASHTGGMLQNIPKSLVESVIRGTFYLMFWLPSAILLTMIIWKQIGKVASNFSQKKITNKQFYSTIGFFILIVFAGFFPSLASTGWNPPRTVAPIFITFILFYFGICIYFYDYLNSKWLEFNLPISLMPTFVIALVFISLSNKHNVMNAYVDLVSLKTYKYHKEVKKVYKELSAKNNDTIYVVPLISKPLTFPIRWPDNYNKLVNGELKDYFHKEVIMKPNL